MNFSNQILEEINKRTQNSFSPFYIYETETIRRNCHHFNNIEYKDKAIHFATMANINLDFLRIVRGEGINVFVNSLLHLEAVMEVGYEAEEIIFTSSGLSREIMQKAGNMGVHMNLDSPNQLKMWESIFQNKPVGIRCNIGDKVEPYSNHAGTFIGKESRLGFTNQEIRELENKNNIQGLHLYAGTDISNIDYLMSCYSEIIEMAEMFPNIEYLNFGGGFGVEENGKNYFDFEEYNLKVSKLLTETSKKLGKKLKLILEPGRIIGGQAGYFVCKVTDLKQRPNLFLAGVNASTVQFSRPLLYPETANHPVAIVRNGKPIESVDNYPTMIYGSSTYSRDIFAKRKNLPKLEMGDLIIFGNAGSYSASSHSTFLGFPKAEEFFI
jgi:diaminopimelate decarboxylase